MLETLITSKTRIKLLLKFFLNANTTAHLRGIETETGDSSNAIRLELNRLEIAGMITSFESGNKKKYQVNRFHPLFNEITALVQKYVGIDILIENIIKRIGKLQKVYLTGSFAKGIDNEQIELVYIGEIDHVFLEDLTKKAEKLILKKIKNSIYDSDVSKDLLENFSEQNFLLLWHNER